jgi:hypothetical protein
MNIEMSEKSLFSGTTSAIVRTERRRGALTLSAEIILSRYQRIYQYTPNYLKRLNCRCPSV